MSSSSPEDPRNIATVVAVKEGLVTVDVSNAAVMKNEVGHILLGDERLKAEVLRVQGDVAVAPRELLLTIGLDRREISGHERAVRQRRRDRATAGEDGKGRYR